MKHVIKKGLPIVIELGGVDYPLTRPTMEQIRDFEVKMDGVKKAGTGYSALMCDHVERCGLPKEIVDKLDPEELQQVVEVLTPIKKP